MSSPLDGRIRSLAREEVAAALDSSPAAGASAGADRVDALEKEITELRSAVKSLTNRLDALAKTAVDGSPEPRPTARRTRKADSES